MTLPLNTGRCLAVVIKAGMIALGFSNGSVRPYNSLVPGLLGDPAWLFRQTSATLGLTDYHAEAAEGVLVVPTWDDANDTALTAEGWLRVTAAELNTGWITYTGPRRHAIHLAVLDRMGADTPMWSDDEPADKVARRLALYHVKTGAAFRSTPGVAGCASIRHRAAAAAAVKSDRMGHKVGQPFWRSDNHPAFLRGTGDMRWSRALPDVAPLMTQVDIRSMYLAAASASMLAWSPLDHTGGCEQFDHTVAGYWQISLSDLPAELYDGLNRPPVINPVGAEGSARAVWVTTPVMSYLNGLGINPDIGDAWVCSRSARILRPWAEAIRDALAVPTGMAAPLKRTYTEAIGMMARTGGSIYRPDWHDTIVDTARVAMLRKFDSAHKMTGAWPVRVYVDGAWYATSTEEHPDYLTDVLNGPNGNATQVGKFRHERTVSAAQYAELYPTRVRRERVK